MQVISMGSLQAISQKGRLEMDNLEGVQKLTEKCDLIGLKLQGTRTLVYEIMALVREEGKVLAAMSHREVGRTVTQRAIRDASGY
jgi:hypothetical protein